MGTNTWGKGVQAGDVMTSAGLNDGRSAASIYNPEASAVCPAGKQRPALAVPAAVPLDVVVAEVVAVDARPQVLELAAVAEVVAEVADARPQAPELAAGAVGVAEAPV